MFKNRALQVKMVKNDNEETPPIDQIESLKEYTFLVGSLITSTIKKVGGAVLLYVAADTIRQVMVEHAKK